MDFNKNPANLSGIPKQRIELINVSVNAFRKCLDVPFNIGPLLS